LNPAPRNDHTFSYRAVIRLGRLVGGLLECTDGRKLFDAPAWQIRQQRNLPKGTNLRDKMDIVELSAIKLTEALATQRITVEDSRCNNECKEATGRTAANVRFAIDREIQDRQKRLIR
jgi:hypothetical protein